MTDTISIIYKPRIKCFPGNGKFYDSVEEKPRNVTGLTDVEILWTGESVYRTCSHHVEQHHAVCDKNGLKTTTHCHGSNEHCNCELFRARSVKLSYSNCYKMVTEELANV